MITKEEAYKLAKAYIDKRGRYYEFIDEQRIFLEENETVIYGKREGEVRNVWHVSYEHDGYDVPVFSMIAIDAETGKVLYTLVPRGYAEDWEEEGFE